MFDVDVHVPAEDGSFVSEKHARIAEMIREYDPHLRLAWIPENRRTDPRDKPFAVIENRQGKDYIAFFADECDERILARLFENDSNKHDVQSRMERENDAKRAYAAKVHVEEMTEMHARAHAVLKSPKSKYTAPDLDGNVRTFR